MPTQHSWSSCHFSLVQEFVAKTRNTALQDAVFGCFSLPFLSDFMGGNREEMLLCPVQALY